MDESPASPISVTSSFMHSLAEEEKKKTFSAEGLAQERIPFLSMQHRDYNKETIIKEHGLILVEVWKKQTSQLLIVEALYLDLEGLK